DSIRVPFRSTGRPQGGLQACVMSQRVGRGGVSGGPQVIAVPGIFKVRLTRPILWAGHYVGQGEHILFTVTERHMSDADIQPFRIDLDPRILNDLQERLQRTRWTSQIPGTGWDAGTDLEYLRDLVNYWESEFDWRAQEKALNAFEHFKARVQDVGIHFIHQRGKGPAPFPLILTHG